MRSLQNKWPVPQALTKTLVGVFLVVVVSRVGLVVVEQFGSDGRGWFVVVGGGGAAAGGDGGGADVAFTTMWLSISLRVCNELG